MTTPSTPLISTAAPTAERAARQPFRLGWMPLAIIVVVVVIAAAVTYWFTVLRFVQSTDDAYVGGNVTVMAPKVNGFVTELLVSDNQRVKANQVLIRLDSRDYTPASHKPMPTCKARVPPSRSSKRSSSCRPP